MRAGLLVVVLLHIWVGARLVPDLPAGVQWPAALVLTSVFLLVSAGGLAALGRGRHAVLTWAGLLAVGLFSSLLVLTLLRDVLWLVLVGVAWAWHGTPDIAGYGPSSAWAVPALAGLATLTGLINARRLPAVRHVVVPIAGLPEALHGFAIVQISDLHVGPTIRRGFVESVVARANAQAADLVVLTGDMVDGSVAELREHTAALGGLRAVHGVLAVTGNHEYYCGAAAWIAEFGRIGLRTLLNEHVVLDHRGAQLVVAGVTDVGAHRFDAGHRSDPARALRGAPPAVRPRVLLAHQPRSAVGAEAAGFDLQLSGHTHGGQFLPWRWFVPLQQPFVAGLARHGALWVYTSRGTGYWGPPKRLGAPSEITRLTLAAVAA